MGLIISYVMRLLASASPALLGKIASYLSKVSGQLVAKTPSGIQSALITLSNNKLGFFGAVSSVALMIPGFDMDKIEELAGSIPEEAVSLLLTDFRKKRDEVRDEVTGDGDPDTIFGVDDGDVITAGAGMHEAIQIRREGIRAAGGVHALNALVAAVFQDRKAASLADTFINSER